MTQLHPATFRFLNKMKYLVLSLDGKEWNELFCKDVINIKENSTLFETTHLKEVLRLCLEFMKEDSCVLSKEDKKELPPKQWLDNKNNQNIDDYLFAIRMCLTLSFLKRMKNEG